ncbi:DUF3618 domain-containing protein [Micromonospora sp. NPDC048871]|uniref:DUF3618 domain-containing protein n=1 Tax=unclassified Micromonospora TaxID=2617518 RepID=UPI002E12887A|nr:DUF3618 domain-containing protein [Micromonospora sp. NBC_01739]
MTRNGSGDTEALREEIQRTRVELGETMEALAAKADIKKRLKSSADQTRERVRDQAAVTVARMRAQTGMRRDATTGSARSGPAPFLALAAGAVVAAVILAIIQGRRG